MKKSALMFLGFCFSLSVASAQDRGFTTKAKLAQVQCAAKGQAFKIRKEFPAVIDDTFLTLIPDVEGGGRFQYRSVHAGLTGGECHIQFAGEFQIPQVNVLKLFPERSSYKTSKGGFDLPCETLRVDQTAEFRVKRILGRTNEPEYLQLDGDDITDQCGGAKRGYQVRLLFEILEQGPTR